ncbi:QcrA and Rieske domain-containing protein [Saccharomonospora halophila]|uniref:QcrA and Rieske domain-containing protein n=1 Tax=Saccharomonospora halophila TaxID=129922 RepID=UPI0003617B61|nr:Rieske (2Fe-2S) protein [Saccharomonospora halophila]
MSGRNHSRRTVLTTGAAVAGAVAGGAALTACGGSGPDGGADGRDTGDVPAGTTLATLDEVPVGGSIPVTTPDGKEAVVSRPSESAVAAFSAVCTHQGCTVRPDRAELRCPCHGSTFDAFTGAVNRGPADRPLPGIDVRIRDDRVVTA